MSQKKQRRKDNMFRFLFSRDPTLFSAAWLPSGPSRATLDTPDKSRKEISRHKGSLCNAVKLHWFSFFFFFCVYLTDNIKLLLCVMPRRALEITLASPLPSWVKMFLGQGGVQRPQHFACAQASFVSNCLVNFNLLLNLHPDQKAKSV